ncbi:MAG TPA: xanthine dehydrogenase family protein molybdopterin-binding subunit [Candidatus Saccharimonadales bacterium]|nr:xanthine dehydrogenase family protein molybdopterin-binding subunit [Candidatus Saccharimonadales bacterium]
MSTTFRDVVHGAAGAGAPRPDSAGREAAEPEPRGLSRRDFLKVCSTAGAGLVIGMALPFRGAGEARAAGADFEPNAWLRIAPDGEVTIQVAKSEMGQGIRTALPMLVAEDLEADWSRVRIEPALLDEKYGQQGTGGSTSVRLGWKMLREAGAAAREMLVEAAAQTWGVPGSACRAENGQVLHPASGRQLGYGELAERASRLPVPKEVTLKPRPDCRLLGRRVARLDTPGKVDGSAEFGLDVHVPGMLYAAVARCPVIGGQAASFEAAQAKAVPGVRHVVRAGSGVAVVADSTWAAFQGREALAVTWDEGANANLSSAGIRAALKELADRPAPVGRHQGDAAAALARAAKRVEAVYELPYLAHATMEPMNCVADVRADRCEVWAPTQWPSGILQAAQQITGLPASAIRVHITLLGGGFGRRAHTDFAVQALLISKAVGAPVQVVWSREDDIQHDLFRPVSTHRLEGGLDAAGRVVAWSHRIAAPSISYQMDPNSLNAGVDPDVIESSEHAYDIPDLQLEFALSKIDVPVWYWRSVYNTQTAFANECFVDELAHAAGADPFEFRRRMLAKAPRVKGALELAAQQAGWGQPLPPGHGRGIAVHSCFGSHVAEVVEASVDAGKVRVHRVVCAVDCGWIVHPDIIETQMQSGVTYGLSAALRGEITLDRGRVQQSNFQDYEVLSLSETPAAEVHIVPSQEAPGGVGEPGLPPAAPALANAIFAATGKRVRSLPVRLG